MKKFWSASVFILAACLASCDDCEEDVGCNHGAECECGNHCKCSDCDCAISLDGSLIKFTIVNLNTNDSVHMTSSFVHVSINGELVCPEISAQNGDRIKIQCEPDEGVSVKSAVYTLHDGTVVKDELEYEYVVSNTETGSYPVTMDISYHYLSACHPITTNINAQFNLVVDDRTDD